MPSEAPDSAPDTDFYAWPRPIPAQYLPILQIGVLLILVTALLLTALPSLPFLHFLLNALFIGALVRRLTRARRGPRRPED